jgi:proteasome lid subunit RPN8/RPN11
MIRISEAGAAAIREHGQRCYPEECCGAILGTAGEQDERLITALLPLENRNEASRRNRFLIEPEDIRQAEKHARETGVELIGFYHSHPDCEARPSRFDLDHAWPWYTYIILSVRQGRADSLTCWQLSEDRSRFAPVELVLVSCELSSKEETNNA